MTMRSFFLPMGVVGCFLFYLGGFGYLFAAGFFGVVA
jgi:hypothetical protein